MKFVLFMGICAAIAQVCLNARLRTQKEATEKACAKGREFNMYSKRCEANKSTITQGDKQLDFYNKYKNPKIVDLLPVFKYEENKDGSAKREEAKKETKKEE